MQNQKNFILEGWHINLSHLSLVFRLVNRLGSGHKRLQNGRLIEGLQLSNLNRDLEENVVSDRYLNIEDSKFSFWMRD